VRRSLPPLIGLVSFGAKREERVRRLVPAVPVLAALFPFKPALPRNSSLIELMVDCTLSGISCI